MIGRLKIVDVESYTIFKSKMNFWGWRALSYSREADLALWLGGCCLPPSSDLCSTLAKSPELLRLLSFWHDLSQPSRPMIATQTLFQTGKPIWFPCPARDKKVKSKWSRSCRRLLWVLKPQKEWSKSLGQELKSKGSRGYTAGCSYRTKTFMLLKWNIKLRLYLYF